MNEKEQKLLRDEEVRKNLREFESEFSDDLKNECKVEYVKSEIERQKKIVDGWVKVLKNAYRRKEPHWFYKVLANDYYKSIQKLKKIRNRLYFLNKPRNGNDNNRITDEDIARAKEYPIENLVEVNSAGFAKCINHNDEHPSMYCKGNFAYCFSCGYTADPIKLAMDINGWSFIETVRRLS